VKVIPFFSREEAALSSAQGRLFCLSRCRRGFFSAWVGTGRKEKYQTQYDQRVPDQAGGLLFSRLDCDLARQRSRDGQDPECNSSHHKNSW
jgi:hypothetical protein